MIVPELPEPEEALTATVSFVLFLAVLVVPEIVGAETLPPPEDPPSPVLVPVSTEFPKRVALFVIFPN